MAKEVRQRTLERYEAVVIAKYLAYKFTDVFERPPLVSYDANAMSAVEVLFRYESLGEGLPESCLQPELLAEYIQAKTNRDFQIEQWRLDGVFTRKHWIEPNGKDLGCVLLPEDIATQNEFFEEDIRSILGDDFNEDIFVFLKNFDAQKEKTTHP